MAYFPMVPKGSAGGFSELLIDYDPNEMTGVTITVYHEASIEGHTPERYIVTLDDTGEVEVDVKNLGDWTIAWTHEGQQYSENFRVEYFGLYHIILHEGFTWRQWVVAGGLPINKYNSLADLLANQADIRRLCTIHAAVDYMCEFISVNNDLETIINTGLFAKWVNLRDYAFDNMEANSAIKDAMDEADLYGYGELVYEDGEWKPKGNVPVMTSNSAPYGSVIGDSVYSSTYEKFNAFNKDVSSVWVSNSADYSVAYIGYMFTNPVKIKKVVYTRDVLAGTYAGTCTAKLQATNDGTNWIDITEELSFDQISSTNEEIEWTPTKNAEAYYLGARLKFLTYIPVTGLNKCNPRCAELQFYGRELKVSVPTMTSNTAPYGEVVWQGNAYNTGSGDWSTWSPFTTANTYYAEISSGTTQALGYDFGHPIKIEKFTFNVSKSQADVHMANSLTLIGSNDGSNWETIESNLSVGANASSFNNYDIEDNNTYRYIEVVANSAFDSGAVKHFGKLQFYGKDYSEKEFANDGSKWLYDHGVELVTITSDTGGAISIEKLDDCILIDDNSTTTYLGAKTENIDLTNFNTVRVHTGKKHNSSYGKIAVVATTTLANVDITANSMPNNNALDISSINQSCFVGVYGSTGTTTQGMTTVAEWWLE